MWTDSGRAAARADTQPPSRPRLAIEAVGLQKSFGGVVALDGLDLAVAEGTVMALVGPNGSGKTTTVRIFSTLLTPDAGTVSVAGHDLSREPELVRSVIGVTGQFSAVDNLLTGRENLALMADLHHLGRRTGCDRAAVLLERFELADAADRPAVTYSGGMRRQDEPNETRRDGTHPEHACGLVGPR
jgi:ABC-2 type transport system ATP-binding protein